MLLALLVFLILLGLGGCEPDEIIIYHPKPTPELTKAPPKGQPSEMEVIQKDIQNLPKVVRKPKYEFAPKQPEIMNVKKQFKACEPACISPSTCNSTTGQCEAIAGKWTPEKEHSEIFMVNSSRFGIPEAGDEYMMRYR